MMKTRMKEFMRLGVVGLFAFGLGLAPALVGVSVAKAEDQLPTTAIDIDKDNASLTIHKRLTDAPSTTPGTGNETTPVDGTALNGVNFKIEKVKLTKPLNTLDGLKEAAALTPDTAVIESGTENTWKDTTAGQGEITKLLPVGVYLVTEEASPNAELPDGKTLVPAAPFLVMIPMTNPANRTEWNYNVHVYPKNQATGALKEVKDEDVQAGQKLTWTITADVPAVPESGKIEVFTVKDDLPFDKVKVEQADIKVETKKGTAAALPVPRENFNLALGTDGKLVITFNEAGCGYLKTTAAGGADLKVLVTIPATVKAPGENGSIITNTATVVTNNGGGAGKVETPTTTTTTYYGKLKIHKENATKTPLAGAVFELYKCGADGKTQGDKISVNNADSWETAKDTGEVTIEGLHVTDFADNIDKTAFEYCLVETKAPKGYELLPAPIKVTFTKEEVFGDSAPTKGLKTVTVENVPSTTPWLPMTGGPGIILLVIAGIAIIAGGSVYGLRSRKATK